MFELRGIRKTFAGTTAVGGVDLEVPGGRTLVLIGPSGCGKSTLLRLMIGLLEPDDGAVLFENERLGPSNVIALRRRMGYVIQSGGLFPHLTARGNAALQARYFGWPEARIEARLRELAELTHLAEDRLHLFPFQLSGGQRQRVGLIRALMLDPDVLLLDEPLGALDPMIRSELQSDLRDVFAALAKTVVLVTHDLAEAVYFADVIVLMHEGRIVQQGTYADLVGQPAGPFVDRFLSAQRALAPRSLA